MIEKIDTDYKRCTLQSYYQLFNTSTVTWLLQFKQKQIIYRQMVHDILLFAYNLLMIAFAFCQAGLCLSAVEKETQRLLMHYF